MRALVVGLVCTMVAGLLATRQAGAEAPPGSTIRPAGVNARTVVQVQDTGLVWLASLIHERGPAVDSIWPGFWRRDRSFMLLRPRTEAVLVTTREPPAGYLPLPPQDVPPALRGRVYRHTSYPAELGHSGLATRFPLEGDTLPAIAPLGSTPSARLVFYFHEAFHGYQHRAFEIPADPSFSSVNPVETGAEFVARAEEERGVLLAALDAPSRDSTLALARRYLGLRAARLGQAPSAAPLEHAVELREGTAEFVACRAAAAVVLSGDGGRSCVRDWLVKPLETWPNLPERNARLMRWRLYGTGAAILVLLDELGGTGWRDKIMRGTFPAQLLHEIVTQG